MTLLTNLIQVGDPYRFTYPKNTSDDCFARSIWDMRFFKDAIYIGCGDYWNDRGPISVMSFIKEGNMINLQEEFIVDEEMVEVFRVYDNTLYILGLERREHGESRNFGSYYFKRFNEWYKRHTLPRAIHVLDIAEFDNQIFTVFNCGGSAIARKSSDDGKTWKQITQESPDKYYGMTLISMNDRLLFVGDEHIFVYKDGTAKKYTLQEPIVSSKRIEYFNGGVLSTPVQLFTLRSIHPHFTKQVPLFLMNDIVEGPKRIPEFNKRGTFVRDIVIQNNICYVMSVHDTSKEGYKTTIKTSENLYAWVKIAEFTVPALPYSFELLNGEIYVGLGNGDRWDDVADPESGTIWRIF